ncbi:MAG: adenylate/guanylate cyclase domain-containing protein [Ignavibacteria bacterium]|nr:adenylate/guanylate cyclase domain-containing protein [Ignavibacteria bacterium]
MTRKEMQYDFDKKEAFAKAEQEKKDALALKELQRQKLLRNSFIGGFSTVLVFAGIFFKQRNKIRLGKERSDELLLNILPEEVAEELKAKGSAEAKHFDEVTVMFTDFKGFTQISERLTPAELVMEIDTCFKAFDEIISKYNIEKIKTIGDSYMCAGGLPVANRTNAADVLKAALEIQEYMREHIRKRESEGKEIFEIRIGIHTGPVVAGIVGVKKFAYDIWGNTVNIASRMESSGETGKVNISGTTYELAKDKFICTYRGKVEAKNKGMIDMYFVETVNS